MFNPVNPPEKDVLAAQLTPTARAVQLGLLGLFFSGVAYAADTPAERTIGPQTTLPAISVEGKSEQETAAGPVQGYIAKRSATGTKTDTPITEIPQAISVITRDELDDRGALSVTEALRYVPGIATQYHGTETRGQDDWINLRGFSGYGTSLYMDGLRMNTDAAAFASQRSEPYGLERIEVLRGPTSVLFGKGDAGGIVNRVSKRPTEDAPRELEVKLGNRNRRQLAADLGGPLDAQGEFLYRVVGVGYTADTQDRYSNGRAVDDSRIYLAPSITWKPSGATSITWLTEAMRDRNKGFAWRYTAAGASNRKTSSILAGEPHYSGFDHDQFSIGYLAEHHINDAWTVRQNTRVSQVDITYRRITAIGLDDSGSSLRRRVRTFEERNNQTAIDTHLEGNVMTGALRHRMLFGIDFERQHTTNLTYTGTVADLNILNPNYGSPVAISPVADNDDSAQRWGQLGIYAQDQISFGPRWRVTAGGRLDRSTVKTLDHQASTVQKQRDTKFSGRIGISYLAASGLTPYLSYAESFLPVVGRDLDSNPYKPTEAKQYELGLKYAPPSSRSLFTAALFDLRKTNVLTADPRDTDYQIQRGEVTSRGLELEAKAELMKGLEAIANLTLNDVQISRSNDADQGKVPTSTPKRLASAWINYRIQSGDWRGLGVGAGIRHYGPTFSDAANLERNAGLNMIDAGLNYDTGKWRFAFNITNLANRRDPLKCVATFGGGRQCAYATERTAVLTAKYRF